MIKRKLDILFKSMGSALVAAASKHVIIRRIVDLVAEQTQKADIPNHGRLAMLDGWRAISIAAVLAGHMLPLGPSKWEMNAAIAANGMAIFFTLSGFLIVSILQRNQNISSFLIRRFSRILPLAWLALSISFAIKGQKFNIWFANFLFYANNPPFYLDRWSSHFWSLDLEVQFYVSIAAIVGVFGSRGLSTIPAAALIVTALRIVTGTEISIVSWLRADEILAGGTLALIIHGDPAKRAFKVLARLPFTPVLILSLLSARPEFGALTYLRAYLTAMMVGITILRPVWLSPLLTSRPAAYLAKISYAVYIIHHFTLFGWLGSGNGLHKYIKRPLCFLITFMFAHLSTFHFEKPIIEWSHRITNGKSRQRYSQDAN